VLIPIHFTNTFTGYSCFQIQALKKSLIGLQMFQLGRARRPATRTFNTAEKVYVTGIALLKMLKHAKAGIPLEVIGILRGRWLDDFTVEVFDVYATPQISTGQSVETSDSAFQVTMDELYKQLGYQDFDVGWYHSHPGFDVWFSMVDCDNQSNYERTAESAVGIVVDPVLSVRGKVVIGAFRVIETGLGAVAKQTIEDPREKTSFIGSSIRTSSTTRASGLNQTFYQLPIVFNMNEHEQKMLTALHRPNWCEGFEIPSFVKNDRDIVTRIKSMREVAAGYRLSIAEEGSLTKEALEIRHVGKVNPKLFLQQNSEELGAHHAALLARLHVTEATVGPK
jgi:26S proteasome regulatory subunit N11